MILVSEVSKTWDEEVISDMFQTDIDKSLEVVADGKSSDQVRHEIETKVRLSR